MTSSAFAGVCALLGVILVYTFASKRAGHQSDPVTDLIQQPKAL